MKRITEQQRIELKNPQGERITEMPEGNLIAVGDVCSFNAIPKQPWIIVYDNKVKRKDSKPEIKSALAAYEVEKMNATNPPGTITNESLDVIEAAMQKHRVKIEIEGEEDLLVIPIVLFAPEGTKVVYGQPGQGMIMITVNNQEKQKMKTIIDRMEEIE